MQETNSVAGLPASTLFIAGWRVPASGGRTYAVHNPARPGEVVGHAALASREDVDSAFAAAQRAFPAWSALSYAERAGYLRRIAERLTADASDLEARTRLFTREHGKVLKEAGIEMGRLGARFTAVESYAERLAQDERLPGPPFDTIVTRKPRGVSLLIVPWNWPLSILGAKLPQALLAGSTVVVKLPEQAAIAPALTVAMMAEILPPGVLNLVTGDAAEIGDAMLTHPLASTINFTGSVRVGKHVMQMAAANLTPVTLELGGNDAALVLQDATLDAEALTRMYLGAFMTSGQICMAIKRLFVHRSRYDELVQGLSAVAARQVVGDGLLPETTMGPLNNARQLQVVQRLIAQARERGAQVEEFGQVPDAAMYRDGHFQKPTLVFDADPALDVVREEQFGPVLPIIPFDSEDEAIRLANDSRFALCSSVWTADAERALRVAKRLEAGYTYINGHGPMAQDNRAPFGGFKDSGLGRNLGFDGVQGFLAPQSISAPSGWLKA
jgi:acyl-CoA reductase-like NAD-dependent aldehyde dehydrogenase